MKSRIRFLYIFSLTPLSFSLIFLQTIFKRIPMEYTLLAQLQRLYRLQQNLSPRILDNGICNAPGFLPQGPTPYTMKEYHRRFLLCFYQKAGEVLGYPCGPTPQEGKYPDQMEFLFPLDPMGEYVHPCTEDRFWKDDPYIHLETKQTALLS